jgi:hypothetical protein
MSVMTAERVPLALIVGCADGFPPGDFDSYVRAGERR